MRAVIFSLLLLLLGACATVPAGAPSYSRAPEPRAGLSNVYIYRLGAYPTLRAPTVSIDGRPVIRPAERAYTVVALTPGAHSVNVNWPWDTKWPDLNFTIDVEPGEPLYLKVSGSFDETTHLADLRPGGREFLLGSSTRQVPQQFAEPKMSVCCRYVRPLTAD